MTTDATRARLLATASSHFARHGFEGASLRRIADDVGIKAASIFHHFPGGKAELYGAIFDDMAATILEKIVTRYGADAGLAPVDAIVQMAAAFWDYFADHGDYAKLILLHASGVDRSLTTRVEEHAADIVAAAHAYVAAAQARGELGDFDVRQFMLFSSAHTLSVHGAPFFAAFLYPNDRDKKLRANYLAMVRAYVQPAGEGERAAKAPSRRTAAKKAPARKAKAGTARRRTSR
jgi:AcrR family transcriptional regulator